jgi:hypothetical protein
MAAQILVEYPGLWPETVRGLIVHSAEWSPGMRSQFGAAATKASYRTLVRACGYGVPSLTRALQCQSNSLTLVAEAEIQPFDRGNTGSIGSKDMHLYVLPWPREALLDLGSTPVEMRVTLSYFVEPGPGRIGWRDRYRYPSHGLRFELNTPTETREAFLSRVNARDSDAEESETGASGPAGHWTLGSKLRDTGSLHSDVWRGTAAELSTSNMIAIRPTIGWWRERHHLGRWSSVCRYSLIVSIRTPSDDVDIYSEVATQIAVPQAVSVPVPT